MKKNLFLLFAIINMAFMANGQLTEGWTEQTIEFDAESVGINELEVVDENVAWLIGYDGAAGGDMDDPEFAKTTDGGANWDAGFFNLPGAAKPANFDASSADRAFCMTYDGSNPAFYETADGGTTWTQVDLLFSGSSSFPNGVTFFDDNMHGFCHGDFDSNNKFEIYYTADGGATWTESPTRPTVNSTNEYSYNGDKMMSVAGTTGYIITNKGRILKSSNYGVDWEITAADPFLSTSQYTSVNVVAASDDIVLCKYGTGTGAAFAWGPYYVSTDGGDSWALLNATGPMRTDKYSDVIRIPGTTSALLSSTSGDTDQPGMSYSTDGGANWTELVVQENGESIHPNSLGFISSSKGYVGEFNRVFKYDDVSITPVGVNNISKKELANISPNPTTGDLYINLYDNKNVDVVVTDILGKVVASFNNVSDNINIDLSNNAKGLYLITVSSNNTFDTQRIIVQ